MTLKHSAQGDRTLETHLGRMFVHTVQHRGSHSLGSQDPHPGGTGSPGLALQARGATMASARPCPSPTHLFLLPLPFGPVLLELLRFLLLGKAHALLREKVIEAFKATIFFFWRNQKGKGLLCHVPRGRPPPRDAERETGLLGQPVPLPSSPARSAILSPHSHPHPSCPHF